MALKSNPTPLEVVKEVKKLGRGVLTYSETLTGVDENDSALLELSKFSRVPEVGDTFACIFNAGDNGAFYQRREVTQIQSLAVIATVLSSNYIPVGDTGIADNAVTTPKIANGAVTKDKVDSGIKGSLGKADSAVQPEDLAEVATSGSYMDLTDTPAIPTIPNITATPSGNGNAVTGITANGHTLTVTKGATFAEQSALEDVKSTADTALQSIKAAQSGNGNAVTDIKASGDTITVTKSETFAKNADLTAWTGRVGTVEGKIPMQASTTNQLADKAFVNSSVQTNTANWRGNWATWTAVPSTIDGYPEDYAGSKTPTVNDYMVVQDASGFNSDNKGTWRFKYSGVWSTNGKGGWYPEYQVNETPLTAAQLSALNSGATSALVGQITTNKNDIAAIKTKNGEQDAAISTAQSTAETANSAVATEAARATAAEKKNTDAITALQTRATNIEKKNTEQDTTIAAAQSTADSALTAANSAQSTADSAAASAKSAGQTANSALGRANVSVRYDAGQGLTADQKARARLNIGAGTSSFSGDYNNLSNKPAAVLYTAQNLTATQMSQARTNLALGSLATKSSITSSDITDGTIVNADISTNAAISASKISGLATVAKSGKYSDLSGKPAEIECYVSPSNDLAYLSIGHSGSIKFQIYGRTEKTMPGTGTRTINFTYSFMYTPIVLLTCSGSGGGTGGEWLQALKVTSVSKTSFSYNKAFKEEGYISWVAFGYDSKL